MNPGNNELQLPLEVVDKKAERSTDKQAERFYTEEQKNPELAPGSELSGAQAQHSMPAPMVDPAMFAQMQAVQSAQAMPVQQIPLAKASGQAEDVDLIEKTWVERAKSIIEKTKDDPYIQKNEISKVKAEYIDRRFNKKIKLVDDQAKP